MRFLDVAAGPGGAHDKSGGGPDDDFRFPERTLRSHGFVSMVFGFALGLTLVFFFLLFHWLGAPPVSGLDALVGNIHPNVWYVFLFGFVAGTVFAADYNFLLFRRLNVLGLDRETN